MSGAVECLACGNQCRRQDTDAGHCLYCGGECMELSEIYPPDDEDQGASHAHGIEQQEAGNG